MQTRSFVLSAVGLLVVGVLVRQELAISRLEAALVDQGKEIVTTQVPVVAQQISTVGVDAAPPPVVPPTASLTPNEIETLRALVPLAPQIKQQVEIEKLRRAAQFEGSEELGKALTLIRTDPRRGYEEMRGVITRIAQGDKQGSRYLIDQFLNHVFQGKEVELDPRDAEKELRAYYKSGTSYVQAVAAGILAKRGDDSLARDYLRRLAPRLEHPDQNVRITAVVDMTSTESPLVVPVAMELVRRDPSLIVRQRATQSLAETGGASAAPLLTQLQSDPSPAVRDAATRELERLSFPELTR